jgi:hypothetical protein
MRSSYGSKKSKSWKVLPKPFRNPETQSDQCKGVILMRKDIAFLAGPRDWGVTRESWLARVPEKVQTVTYRTVKALWYGEITDTDHWAARDIRRAVEIIRAQRDAAELAERLQSIATGLDVTDPNFHRPTITALLGTIRQLRGEDRS